MERKDTIEKILDNAQISAGQDVLDVACGNGILFPYYLKRNVASVTGVDISGDLTMQASQIYANDPRVQVLCMAVEEMGFRKKYDRIVVYNALPAFPNPKHLVRVLAGMLKENGHLTIAHDFNQGAEPAELMEAEKLQKLFVPRLRVEVMISNNNLYQVSGVRKDPLANIQQDGDEEDAHSLQNAAAPIEELLVLMRYLVSHNDAHAQEIADLASQLRTVGKFKAYKQIMDTVAEFDIVNAKLDAVLKSLLVEEY